MRSNGVEEATVLLEVPPHQRDQGAQDQQEAFMLSEQLSSPQS